MNCAAPPASTTTRYSAACTTLFVRTTPSAAIAIAAAMMPNATFSATTVHRPLVAHPSGSRLPDRWSLLLALGLGAEFERFRLGHGLHPLAEAILVVQQVGDALLGVLELGAPEQRVERAHLDADAAVHAQRVVDVEAVEHVDRTRPSALTARRTLLLVALDVDAPVGARTRAQHADGAVLLLQRDDATRARRGVFTFVRVLHRDRRLQHRLQRDAEATHHSFDLALHRYFTATFKTPVTKMFTSAIGMSHFHAIACN